MGSTYTTLVGAPPSPLTLQFFKWVQDLVTARQNECPRARTTEYYFSQSTGSDSTGTGSQANPYKTIAKAQAIHDAAATDADIRLRFKRGDEWNETTGLTITKNKVTIDDYGTGAKPFFNRFTIKYNSAGWTLAAGDRYTRTETNAIAWVRDQADRLNPYSKQANATDVGNTARSFWHDTGTNTLHINAGAGVNPNTKNLEAVANNSAVGVELNGDFGRVENIRADGWGMDLANTNNQKHGFKGSGKDAKSNVFKGCDCYYSSAHTIAYNGGSTVNDSGGYATFIDCKAGFPLLNASGENIFNTYVSGGNQEAIFYNCETKYGTLPEGTATYNSRAAGVYCHTSGDAAPIGLYLVYGHRTPISNWPPDVGVSGENVISATNIVDCRAFNIFERKEFPPTSLSAGNTQCVGRKWMANINCIWQVRPKDLNPTPRALVGAINQHGWMINSILDIDAVNQTASMHVWNHSSDVNTMKIWHSMIYVRGNKSTGFGLDFDSYGGGAISCTGAEMKNSIIALQDPGGNNYVAFNGNAAKMVNNAYSVDSFTDSTGTKMYSVDATRADIAASDVLDIERSKITSEHPLYQKGSALNLGYDINLNLRGPTPSIGPWDAFKPLDLGRVTALTAAIASSTSITLSWTAANGLVNITDHEVKYRVVGNAPWTTFTHVLNPGNSITVTGLIAKTEYEFSVAPISAWGTGNPEFVKATPYASADIRRTVVKPKVFS